MYIYVYNICRHAINEAVFLISKGRYAMHGDCENETLCHQLKDELERELISND